MLREQLALRPLLVRRQGRRPEALNRQRLEPRRRRRLFATSAAVSCRMRRVFARPVAPRSSDRNSLNQRSERRVAMRRSAAAETE